MKMREEDESNWFSRWEEQLPLPEELVALSQTLISPDLALAFNILPHPPPVPPQNSTSAANFPPNHSNKSPEFENSGDYCSGATAGDESARTLKRPRLVWTPQLHKRFVDAVAHLGIKNAVPKTIMQLMSVDGLTRENVASHLQKYRLYLKRMQGLSGGGGNGGLVASSDPMDHLFASSPVPAHFLHPGRSSSDHYMPFVPVTALQHHQQQHQHHHHQHNLVSAVVHPQYNNQHRQSGHPFLRQQLQLQQQQPVHRTMPGDYSEDLESSAHSNGGRKVLTLFPSGA